MIIGIKNVEYIKNYELKLIFTDGKIKTVNLEKFLDGEIFEPLKDINYFKTVRVDEELDTICWNNGADFSPEFLYELES